MDGDELDLGKSAIHTRASLGRDGRRLVSDAGYATQGVSKIAVIDLASPP